MKKIIYKGTIEENDYNRVKDIDSENYITCLLYTSDAADE